MFRHFIINPESNIKLFINISLYIHFETKLKPITSRRLSMEPISGIKGGYQGGIWKLICMFVSFT